MDSQVNETSWKDCAAGFLSRKSVRAVLGFLALALPCWGLFLQFEASTEKQIPFYYVLFGCAAAGVVGALRGAYGERFALWESWKTFSVIANGKAVSAITVALTVVPIVVSIMSETGASSAVPFTLYLYWISGLSLSVFLLVYKTTAPLVYRYSSFQQLLEKEGGVTCLRNDATPVLAEIDRQLGKPTAQPSFIAGDRKVLARLADGYADSAADVYYVMREYSAEFKRGSRILLSVLLILPAFIIPTVTAIKITTVGYQANKAAQSYDGWWKATYHQMFELAPNRQSVGSPPASEAGSPR